MGAAALGAFFAVPALAAAPTAVTGAAGSVTYQSATLTGAVNPGGESTEVYFQYGTTNTYGVQSAPTELPAGATAVAVSIPIAGLTADTKYHYRLVATNATRTALGADRTLVTAKIPLALAITAAPNPAPYGGAVTVEGTLSGTGSAGAAVQLQQSAFPYTEGFSDIGNPELTLANGTFVFNELGIALNTEYRVVSGTVASAAVGVSVSVAVTLNAHATGTHRHPSVFFSGTIAPGEPSARIAFERLVGTSWKVVGGTVAKVAVNNGVVGFSKTVRINVGGFFRALVLPVEGAHVSGYSQTVVIRLK
ncbi:MAG TPA: hypothetical protein VN740_00780 [Solirubrobacteraceae bacterium]|nr:hypothetical protein [Solirubrobacteraceae bacterium]